MDLLNKIFVIDSSKRISLQGIKDHPWYNEPLSAKYAEGEEKIRKSQEEIDQYVASRRLNQACSLAGCAVGGPDLPLDWQHGSAHQHACILHAKRLLFGLCAYQTHNNSPCSHAQANP